LSRKILPGEIVQEICGTPEYTGKYFVLIPGHLSSMNHIHRRSCKNDFQNRLRNTNSISRTYPITVSLKSPWANFGLNFRFERWWIKLNQNQSLISVMKLPRCNLVYHFDTIYRGKLIRTTLYERVLG